MCKQTTLLAACLLVATQLLATHNYSGVGGPSIATAGLHLFPDPTPGRFSVELPENIQAGAIFRIVSLTGQLFREEPVQAGVPTQQIQTDDLPAGLYFLQMIATGKLLAVQRFVKD